MGEAAGFSYFKKTGFEQTRKIEDHFFHLFSTHHPSSKRPQRCNHSHRGQRTSKWLSVIQIYRVSLIRRLLKDATIIRSKASPGQKPSGQVLTCKEDSIWVTTTVVLGSWHSWKPPENMNKVPMDVLFPFLFPCVHIHVRLGECSYLGVYAWKLRVWMQVVLRWCPSLASTC